LRFFICARPIFSSKRKTKLFFGGASKASGGGAERIIDRFAQKIFELRPKSTATKLTGNT